MSGFGLSRHLKSTVDNKEEALIDAISSKQEKLAFDQWSDLEKTVAGETERDGT